MLAPKRVKRRKTHKGKMRGKAYRGSKVSFGQYGLQATQASWITNRQIESARVAITRHVRRGGKVWIRIFPDKPITKKPAETRMGKGKGNPEEWVAVVKPGRIMFELEGVPEETARRAMELASFKLPSRRASSRGIRNCKSIDGIRSDAVKAEEVRELENAELEHRLGELKMEQFRLRFRGATMQLENPKLRREIRRDIARIKTILHERRSVSDE